MSTAHWQLGVLLYVCEMKCHVVVEKRAKTPTWAYNRPVHHEARGPRVAL